MTIYLAPKGTEDMGGAWVNTWGEHGGRKTVLLKSR